MIKLNKQKRLLLSAIVALQVLSGIGVILMITRKFGVGIDTDIYFLSQAIPLTFFAILSTPIMNIWIGTLSKITDQVQLSRKYGALGTSVALLCLLSLCSLPLIEELVELIYTSYSNEITKKISEYTSVLMIAAIFELFALPMLIYARSRDRFLLVESIYMVTSFIHFAFIYSMRSDTDFSTIIYLILLRSILIAVAALVFIGFPKLNLEAFSSKEQAWRQMLPVFILGAVTKNNSIVDNVIISSSGAGNVSIYSISMMIISTIGRIIQKSWFSTDVPHYNRLIAEKDFSNVRIELSHTLIHSLIASIVVFSLVLCLREPIEMIIGLVLLTEDASSSRIFLVTCLLFGSIFTSTYGTLPVAILYGLGSTLLPSLIGITSFFGGIVVKLLFFQFYGLEGVAIGHTLYFLFTTILISFCLDYKLRKMKR